MSEPTPQPDPVPEQPTVAEPLPPSYGAPPPPPPPPVPGAPVPYGYAPGYYYVDPTLKSRMAAGLLGIFLGGWGVHRFYLGYTSIGVVQIVVTVLTCGVGALWGLIEGIMILANSGITTDAQGRPLRE